MGLEERQARPHRQGRCHQQARPEIQGRRRLAKAPEAARTDPGILRRPPPALHHRITGTGRLTYALLGNLAVSDLVPDTSPMGDLTPYVGTYRSNQLRVDVVLWTASLRRK